MVGSGKKGMVERTPYDAMVIPHHSMDINDGDPEGNIFKRIPIKMSKELT